MPKKSRWREERTQAKNRTSRLTDISEAGNAKEKKKKRGRGGDT